MLSKTLTSLKLWNVCSLNEPSFLEKKKKRWEYEAYRDVREKKYLVTAKHFNMQYSMEKISTNCWLIPHYNPNLFKTSVLSWDMFPFDSNSFLTLKLEIINVKHSLSSVQLPLNQSQHFLGNDTWKLIFWNNTLQTKTISTMSTIYF